MRYLKLLMLTPFCMPIAASEYERDYFSLSFENDVFFHEDGGYSNGLVFSWGYYDVPGLDKTTLPRWISFLADQTYLPSLEDRQYAISYTFGQFLQTAVEIKDPDLVTEDAPYVGLLAWEVDVTAFNEHVADKLSLTLGVVGPLAGGEYVQKNIHGWIGASEPMGWDNQINNEPVFRVQAKRIWRNAVLPIGPTEVDLITGVNGGLGNLKSDTSAGVGLRWGQELQSSFASSSPFAVQKLNGLTTSPNGWYVFVNASASYVLNDIFMDGNTFSDSHSVDLIHWQAAASIGAQLNLYDWNFIYTLIYSTDQYKSQTEDTRFGTISITYHF
ncbi:lipid A deacylase LpxR family protein [Psychromonas sp. RZ22]|uniref:lipid A deacylase LpxR family protein n=1 Tax=Psychromonas algarum TaxID=2555643 RepID=UPI0010677F5D|nr:lipid A deacylase LpxR family protein [Psychromonas sp. RZ22]TEW54862.1 lipid A deacylase LpxR family protein [Psychromonas sp. RZ22]